MSRLEELGERTIITRLAKFLRTDRSVITGIGDDCAVVRAAPGAEEDLVLTSDPILEGIHFVPDTPGEAIGHKAMGRVLSDLAAMGASPRWALTDLTAPPHMEVERIDAIYRGIAALAHRHGLTVVGGDTGSGPLLQLHVFAIGCVPVNCAVLRSGARAGDRIFVTGALGGSLHGKHLSFSPRVEEGGWLREHSPVSAMVDLSDGLMSDLGQITAASDCGAQVMVDHIPISAAVEGRDPAARLRHALTDGEDYELLFTVGPGDQAWEQAWSARFPTPITEIGAITSAGVGTIFCNAQGQAVTGLGDGYQHFQPPTDQP